MKCRFVINAAVGIFLVGLAAQPARSQTLLSQTTWGGAGSDVASGVAMAADGSTYVVGITDSFTVDQFGTPSPRIFVVKFDVNATLAWQRIWNGPTVRGLGRTAVAIAADGSVYVTGVSTDNGNDAVLLKFTAAGTLLWERAWGGVDSDESFAVAAAADGSAYIAGTATSFGPSSAGLFVVKFDAGGNLVWQRVVDGAAGNGITVAPDGSVYAAGTVPRDANAGTFDLLVVKISGAGALIWQRAYAAGDVADPRGGIAASPDGSVVAAGAIQVTTARSSDIAGLIVKLDAGGALVFDKQFDGRVSETAEGVAVDQADASIYVAGTTTSFGAGFQDAYVLHLQPTGKKLLSAVTWGGSAFEEGAGVAVGGTAVALAATTTAAGPYVLQAAAARLSTPKSVLSVSQGTFRIDVVGTVANPAAGATTPAGSTIFSGNFEAALVRIAK
jgi:hypothetical protein